MPVINSDWDIGVKARAIHADSIVWDNHVCLPLELEKNLEFIPQLHRFHSAGVDVISLNIGYGRYG